MSAIVSFSNVSKTFNVSKTNHHAVNNLSLTIEKGEIFGIIGQSGAGKSTLIRLINQLEKPTSGVVRVFDKQVGNLCHSELKKIRSKIGMIFQNYNLFNSKTVANNIAFPLKLNGIKKQEREKTIDKLLDFVDLSDKKYAHPSTLSGGQKQRVSIARALATDPQILLADEPTSALDPATTLEVLYLLKKVVENFGITIILITHDMSVIKLICDKVAILNEGKLVETGTVKQIFEDPKEKITKDFIDTLKVLELGDISLYEKLKNKAEGNNEKN